jgi:hypothetical protein
MAHQYVIINVTKAHRNERKKSVKAASKSISESGEIGENINNRGIGGAIEEIRRAENGGGGGRWRSGKNGGGGGMVAKKSMAKIKREMKK